MTTPLEDLIKESAKRIVYGGTYSDGRKGTYRVSLNSERANLNTIVKTLLHNEVTLLKEEKNDKGACINNLESDV